MASLAYKVVNYLSVSRILGAAAFLAMALDPNSRVRQASILVLLLLLLTDLADGYLARRLKVVSAEGYILDGLGDRSAYLAVLLVLCSVHLIPFVACFLIVVRDLLLYGMRAIYPNWRFCIEGGRTSAKVNALILRITLGVYLADYYASQFEMIRPLAKMGPSVLARAILVAYIILSYVLLARTGRRLLKAAAQDYA